MIKTGLGDFDIGGFEIECYKSVLNFLRSDYIINNPSSPIIEPEKSIVHTVDSFLFIHDEFFSNSIENFDERFYHKSAITICRNMSGEVVVIDGARRLLAYSILVLFLIENYGYKLPGDARYGSISISPEVTEFASCISKMKAKLKEIVNDEVASKLMEILNSDVIMLRVRESSQSFIMRNIQQVLTLSAPVTSEDDDFDDAFYMSHFDGSHSDEDEEDSSVDDYLDASNDPASFDYSGINAILRDLDKTLEVFKKVNPELYELSKEELCSKYQAGSREALEILIAKSCSLVLYATRNIKYRNYRDDLFLSGLNAIVKAAGKFNPSKGFKFDTYAKHWVKCYVDREYIMLVPSFHFSDESYRRMMKVYFVSQSLGDMDEESKLIKISEITNLSVDVVKASLCDLERFNTQSFDVSLSDEDDGYTLENLYLDNPVESPEEYVSNDVDREIVAEYLNVLTPRHRDILILKYGLDGKEEKSYQAIADEYGVTKMRIKQIVDAALEKIRKQIKKDKHLAEINPGYKGRL